MGTLAPMTTAVHPVLVLDMATLRFLRAGTALRVATRSGLVLGAVHPRRNEARADMAFRAMDAALNGGRVLEVSPEDPRARVHREIALYNPFSADIAYGPVPQTLTFNNGGPLPIDPDGTPATLTLADGKATLTIDSVALHTIERGPLETSRIIAAQRVG